MSVLALFAVIVVIFAAAVGGGFFFYFYKQKVQNQINNDTTMNPNLQTATDMLPFRKIWKLSDDFAITDLGNGEYRAYIQVGSINYNLESQVGKNKIEANYRYLINSFDHPWIWHTETHNIDNSEREKALDEDVKRTLESLRGTKSFDYVRNYYARYKKNLVTQNMDRIRSGLVKKEVLKYVIIPFNSDKLDPSLNKDQAFAESVKQIIDLVNQFISELAEMNISAHYLSRGEIIKLYTSEYNRDDTLFAEGIADGSFTTVFADVNNQSKSYYLDYLNNVDKLHLILDRAENSINTSILRLDDVEPDVQKEAEDISNYISEKLKIFEPQRTTIQQSQQGRS